MESMGSQQKSFEQTDDVCNCMRALFNVMNELERSKNEDRGEVGV